MEVFLVIILCIIAVSLIEICFLLAKLVIRADEINDATNEIRNNTEPESEIDLEN